MNLELQHQRVLVTASSRGIGLGIAKAFAREGARVWICGRSAARLKQAQAAVRRLCELPNVETTACDLLAPEAGERLLHDISKRWGGLDVLVFNFGSGRGPGGLECPRSEWQRMLDTNLLSAMDLLGKAMPLLRRGRRPSVVFIGSIAGRETLGAPLPYGAAKAALHHAMKASARIAAADGIRVNLVAPGNIYFRGGTWDVKCRTNPTGVAEMLERQVPMQRFGTPREVADAVLFLASARSSFTTGTCLVVDGGQTVFPA